MWSLYEVDNMPGTQASFCCYLHMVLECSWFSIMRCWINFKIGFWRANTLIGPNGPHYELIYHDDMVCKGWIKSRAIPTVQVCLLTFRTKPSSSINSVSKRLFPCEVKSKAIPQFLVNAISSTHTTSLP